MSNRSTFLLVLGIITVLVVTAFLAVYAGLNPIESLAFSLGGSFVIFVVTGVSVWGLVTIIRVARRIIGRGHVGG